MGTLVQKCGPNGDQKTEKGPHGDRVPQMGTPHVATVAFKIVAAIFIHFRPVQAEHWIHHKDDWTRTSWRLSMHSHISFPAILKRSEREDQLRCLHKKEWAWSPWSKGEGLTSAGPLFPVWRWEGVQVRLQLSFLWSLQGKVLLLILLSILYVGSMWRCRWLWSSGRPHQEQPTQQWRLRL